MMEAMEFKAWRYRLAWTQAQAGNALGFSNEHVCRLETGVKPITRVVELACQALENSA